MTNAPTTDPLAELFAPLTPDAFFADYWGARSLYVAREAAHAERFGLTLDRALGLLYPSPLRPAVDARAQYFDTQGAHRVFALPPGGAPTARDLLAAGMTLCFSDFERHFEPAMTLATALGQALGVPTAFDVACYVSEPGHGFGMHFDNTPVLVVQCEGSKRWRFAETPSLPDPDEALVASSHAAIADFARRHPAARLEVPREGDLCDRVLTPGDVLFLPGGTWHRTYAEDTSVALTFSLSPRRLNDALAGVVATLLAGALPRTPRRPAPGAPAADLNTWVRALLPDLRRAAATLDDDAIVARLGLAKEAAPRAPFDGAASEAWGPGTEFRPADRASLALFTIADDEGGRQAHVYYDDEGVGLDAAFVPVIEALLARDRFTLAEAGSLVDDAEGARTLLAALVEIGALSAG